MSSSMEAVASVDPLLATWRSKGRSRARSLEQPVLDTTPAGIESALRVQQRDVGGEEMPELGFSWSAWNGAAADEDQAGVSVGIGLNASKPGLRNRFVLDLPASWPEDDARVDSLVRALVVQLDPDEVVRFGDHGGDVLWSRS